MEKSQSKKRLQPLQIDLQKLFNLSMEAAEILMKVKGTKTPYEALIDGFEPQMSAQTITKTFNGLLAGLKPLIAKIENSQTQPTSQTPRWPSASGGTTQNHPTHHPNTRLRHRFTQCCGKSRRDRTSLHLRLLRRRPHNHPLLPKQLCQLNLLSPA